MKRSVATQAATAPLRPARSNLWQVKDREALDDPQARLLTVLDEIDFGVCLCDPTARLLAANRAAREELANGRLLGLENGQIRSGLAACQQSFDRGLQEAATKGLKRMVSLRHGFDHLTVTLSPAETDTSNSVVVLFGRRAVCSPLGVELLAGVHGLTYGERRVLGYLLAGERPSTICRELGVTVSTVRTQIKSIRAKFDVDSVDALLLRVASAPPVAAKTGGKGFSPPDLRASLIPL